MLTTCHHHDSNFLKILYFFWNADIIFVADTKLAMVVESPSVKLFVFVDIERVMITGPDILSILCCNTFNHKCLFVLVTSVKHATKFPALWVTPSENLAISCQS
jgi:hypothetical protein